MLTGQDTIESVWLWLGQWAQALPPIDGAWWGPALALLLAAAALLVARAARRRRANAGAATTHAHDRAKSAAAGSVDSASSVSSEDGAPDGVRRYLAVGAAAVVLLVGGLGGWSASTEIAGAVLAPGIVVVDSNVKKVQHPTGGVVGEIRVKDGDRVAAGELLMRLDETTTRANLQVVTKQLDELAMRQARLKAERDGAERVEVPEALLARQSEREVAEIIAGERSLFESRRSGRTSQKAQLRERIGQLGEEIRGLAGQHAAKSEEAELVRRELNGLERLEGQQLTTTSRLTQARRDVARLEGERSQLTASIAQARGKIIEIELQILQVDHDLRTEIVKELREAQGREAELVEKRVLAEDQLKRVDIRSPQSGTVHQLAVHTVGGVVTTSEPIMLIVPSSEKLVLEVRVAPQDIEQVHAGQPALVRLTAFNQRTTPEIRGTVQRVAADITRDAQTGQSYFVARVALQEADLAGIGGVEKLVPGMPADVQIRTRDRTVLSYLLKPLEDQLAKAFRER